MTSVVKDNDVNSTTTLWYYCNKDINNDSSHSNGITQKGPVPSVVLCRLLEKGISVNSNTLVWKADMDSWLRMAEVRCILIFLIHRFFYRLLTNTSLNLSIYRLNHSKRFFGFNTCSGITLI